MKIINKKNSKKYNVFNPKEEINILKRLCCKYIVKTYEIFETPNEKYMIMEYIPKNSLLENLEFLDLDNIWKYFRNLISGIEYCKINKI